MFNTVSDQNHDNRVPNLLRRRHGLDQLLDDDAIVDSDITRINLIRKKNNIFTNITFNLGATLKTC